MPRFVRELPDNGRELLPMCEVLKYLLDSNKKLIDDETLKNIHNMTKTEWQNFADFVKGMVVTNPGMKPCSLRVDQLDRDTEPEVKIVNASSPGSSRASRSMSQVTIESKRSRSSSPDKKDVEEVKNNQEIEILESISSKEEEGEIKSESQENNDADNESICASSASNLSKKSKLYPEIVHFGIRPPQLSYAGNPEYVD